MGGIALMEFTKRFFAEDIQAAIDRIVIVDIPTTPIIQTINYPKTGKMLHSLREIDTRPPLEAIHDEIDKRAFNPAAAQRMKNQLRKEGEGYAWKVNLKTLD
jgi:hypothetical protein